MKNYTLYKKKTVQSLRSDKVTQGVNDAHSIKILKSD